MLIMLFFTAVLFLLLTLLPLRVLRDGTNLEIQVDIETKPSHLCLTSEEDLAPHPGCAATATGSGGEEPQDCSSRRGGALSGSVLGLSPGASIREGLRDVTLAQPESIRSDLEMSDTQSDDIAELTSDDCDSPHPNSRHPAAGQPAQPTSCRAPPTDGLHCPTDSNVVLYVWGVTGVCSKRSQPAHSRSISVFNMFISSATFATCRLCLHSRRRLFTPVCLYVRLSYLPVSSLSKWSGLYLWDL